MSEIKQKGENDVGKNLDQFYTQDKVAKKCVTVLKRKMKDYIDFDSVTILEPSAGTGAFLKAINKSFNTDVVAYDLEPKYDNIIQRDYLTVTKEDFEGKEVLTIGNPPFGKRSKLAMDFFNISSQFSHTIAFIVPAQFDKYSVQNNLNKDFKLIHSEILDPNSFVFNGKDYSVRCVFQIWTTLDTKHKNKRITQSPDTKHDDFEMWQYNNTVGALKYFDYDWDFAVPRQGYYDYSMRITDKSELKKNIQYIFFKAKDVKVLDRLKSIDFDKLSKLNTSTPGFGKADVINSYRGILKNEK